MAPGFIGIFINEPSVTKSLARGITKERDSSCPCVYRDVYVYIKGASRNRSYDFSDTFDNLMRRSATFLAKWPFAVISFRGWTLKRKL